MPVLPGMPKGPSIPAWPRLMPMVQPGDSRPALETVDRTRNPLSSHQVGRPWRSSATMGPTRWDNGRAPGRRLEAAGDHRLGGAVSSPQLVLVMADLCGRLVPAADAQVEEGCPG